MLGRVATSMVSLLSLLLAAAASVGRYLPSLYFLCLVGWEEGEGVGEQEYLIPF